MSFLKHVQRQTKNICHVRETASGSLQAIVKRNGNEYTRTHKNTQEDADRLIRWINQTYAMEVNAGPPPNLEQLKRHTVLDVIEWHKQHPTPKRDPKRRLSKSDLTHLNRLTNDPIAKVTLAAAVILINAANNYVNRRKAKVEITTVDREVTLFRVMFNKAETECGLSVRGIPNPFKKIQLHYNPKEYAGTRNRLSPEEKSLILRDLEPDSKAYARARRLTPSCMAARVTKARRVLARFS